MLQGLRWRLLFSYLTIMAAILSVFGTGVYVFFSRNLYRQLDKKLLTLAQSAAPSFPEVEKNGSAYLNRVDKVPWRDIFNRDRQSLEWFDAQGNTLGRKGFSRIDFKPKTGAVNLPEYVAGFPSRAYTISVFKDSAIPQEPTLEGFIRASQSVEEIETAQNQLLLVLSCGGLATLLLSGLGGIWLTQKAIEPIEASYFKLKQFTADASHELRNPIALIQTNVQVALADPELEMPEQRQQLEVIERLTQRLGRLVDDLLFLARQDSGMLPIDYQPCPLDAVLMEVVEDQRALATHKGVYLNLNLEETGAKMVPGEESFSVIGDYDQLVRLFTNLVSNGIQYTPAEGGVRVTLKQSLRQGIPYLKAKVEDEGLGIPAEAIPHVFDRFYRADPARQRSLLPATQQPVASGKVMGTGLGLAIAQAICHNHQGQMTVCSTLQQGTTFTVMLPQQVPKKIEAKSVPLNEINQLP